ncbi:carboxypeptidase-like regulatory domain-containing protein [Candidatus Micrarchaeota archaeon]|nr:carboxypeptidase-like regulatory domain-containing protein [Candidatus Micrarchaeota archaeon]MBU1681655.1 carboxypeptidase-like regulatory domain-containing protein [Candidatus Micrarchaeota archaeon]
MKILLALLLIFGMSYAATLMTFDVKTENTCDEKTEITRVTVTSGSNKPVENAYVKVEDIDPWKQKTSGTVDSDGVFEFEGCGDTWNVTVSYGGYETKIKTIELGSCGSCVAAPEPEPEENETEADPPPVEPEEETTTPPVVDAPKVTPPPTNPKPELYETDDEEPEEETTNEKKPLPCCASTTILLGLVGLFAIRLKA